MSQKDGRYVHFIFDITLTDICNYFKQNNMGRISNCFEEHSDQFVNLLSKELNHIVFMLHTRNAITEEQKLSILDSSLYSGMKKLFEYIEINEEILRTFIGVLYMIYRTENGGIANFVQSK